MTDDDPSRGLHMYRRIGVGYRPVVEPNHVETVIARLADGHLWKYSRYFDNRQYWSSPDTDTPEDVLKVQTERDPVPPSPDVMPAWSPLGYEAIAKDRPEDDEFEMYDLDDDPMELAQSLRSRPRDCPAAAGRAGAAPRRAAYAEAAHPVQRRRARPGLQSLGGVRCDLRRIEAEEAERGRLLSRQQDNTRRAFRPAGSSHGECDEFNTQNGDVTMKHNVRRRCASVALIVAAIRRPSGRRRRTLNLGIEGDTKMKKLICLAVLLSLFAFTSTVAAYEPPDPPGAPYVPENVPVNPILLEQYQEMFPPEVLQVTDGVWVARGYNRDNPALIEGVNGLIVVDPGESIPAAEAGKAAFNAALNNIFDRKPVKAIIYTHHHDCHVNGASVYADENTEIIGHENLLSSMYSEWFGQVFPSRAEGGLKMAGASVHGRSRYETCR